MSKLIYKQPQIQANNLSYNHTASYTSKNNTLTYRKPHNSKLSYNNLYPSTSFFFYMNNYSLPVVYFLSTKLLFYFCVETILHLFTTTTKNKDITTNNTDINNTMKRHEIKRDGTTSVNHSNSLL